VKLSDVTIGALVALAAWFVLDFVGVPNVVEVEPLFSPAGLMLAVLAGTAAAGLMGLRWVAAVYLLALAIWAALQIETHWGTYLLYDASAQKLAWYQRVFGPPHWRFLPEFANRTTPDGYHTILGALILVNLGLALRDCVRRS
jgi:hypothetical protein